MIHEELVNARAHAQGLRAIAGFPDGPLGDVSARDMARAAAEPIETLADALEAAAGASERERRAEAILSANAYRSAKAWAQYAEERAAEYK